MNTTGMVIRANDQNPCALDRGGNRETGGGFLRVLVSDYGCRLNGGVPRFDWANLYRCRWREGCGPGENACGLIDGWLDRPVSLPGL